MKVSAITGSSTTGLIRDRSSLSSLSFRRMRKTVPIQRCVRSGESYSCVASARERLNT